MRRRLPPLNASLELSPRHFFFTRRRLLLAATGRLRSCQSSGNSTSSQVSTFHDGGAFS
jgi:hypothetical protein